MMCYSRTRTEAQHDEVMTVARKSAKTLRAEAEGARYYATVETVPVAMCDLRPGMVLVRPSGERRRVVTVGEDVCGIVTGRIEAARLRGLPTEGTLCYTSLRLDTWGLQGADFEQECEVKTGPTLTIAMPDVSADVVYRVEVDSVLTTP